MLESERRAELKSQGTEPEEVIEVQDISEFKNNIQKWLHIEDLEIIDIISAGMVGEKVGGDPVWLFLIAPPGGTKTELLRSFQGEEVIHLSDMTSKTLISGLMIGEGENRKKVEDLLPQLDGKTLIFKDFTTILEKGRDERREIIAQFREAYDGSFSKKVGTVDKVIKHVSRFGLVAGVTPVIDKHWKVMQQLGERFLKVRWNENSTKTTEQAMKNEGKEKEMRAELINNSRGFLNKLNFNNVPEFDNEKYGLKIMNLAKFVAHARTPLSIRASNDEFYHDYIPMPEVPTRLVKQLKKMAKCLAFVRNKEQVTDEEIKTIERIAFDTIPADRRAVLKIIKELEHLSLNGCPRNKIYEYIKMPESSVRNVLEQLKLLDLVELSPSSHSNTEVNYKVNELYPNNSICLQEMSGGTPESVEVKEEVNDTNHQKAMVSEVNLHVEDDLKKECVVVVSSGLENKEKIDNINEYIKLDKDIEHKEASNY